jgi:tetratricopeptide (TPR) repeat protein
LVNARNSLAETIKLAPTDAKLYYNLGIADANLGQYQLADADLKTAVDLKANYIDARIEYAALLVHLKRNDEAKAQLNYVLTNIDPGNSTAKQALANIK